MESGDACTCDCILYGLRYQVGNLVDNLGDLHGRLRERSARARVKVRLNGKESGNLRDGFEVEYVDDVLKMGCFACIIFSLSLN